MDDEFKYLEKIVGKEVLEITTEVNSTYAINEPTSDPLIEIPLRLAFYDYTLFIYNRWEIVGMPFVTLGNLKGHSIREIKFALKILEIWLDNLCHIKVDMNDDGYFGPEALVLHGPNDLTVVWN